MKVPCDDGNIKIGFIAFSDTATNIVVLRQFKKASDFKILVDTAIITKGDSSYKKYNDTLRIQYSFNFKNGYTSSRQGLTSEFDYEIYLPALNKAFRIEDIVEEYKSQKKGFISDNSSCNNSIKSYTLDGQKIIVDDIYLTIYFHG